MYHSISDPPLDRSAVTPGAFRVQMRYLAEHGFRALSLEDACRRLDSQADLRRTVVLTFDDGYLDFVEQAAPVLCELGMTATLFVVTGATGGAAHWNRADPARRTLDAAQLEQVQKMGFTLGSHTVTHRDLTTLDEDELARELSESRKAISRFGKGFCAFAYPGGRFTPREEQAVRAAGYDCAVIVGGRWGNGSETVRWQLKREPVMQSDTPAWFARRVNGYYEPAYVLARLRGVDTR